MANESRDGGQLEVILRAADAGDAKAVKIIDGLRSFYGRAFGASSVEGADEPVDKKKIYSLFLCKAESAPFEDIHGVERRVLTLSIDEWNDLKSNYVQSFTNSDTAILYYPFEPELFVHLPNDNVLYGIVCFGDENEIIKLDLHEANFVNGHYITVAKIRNMSPEEKTRVFKAVK